MARQGTGGGLLESHVIYECHAIVGCHAFCSPRFERAHFEALVTDTLDPGHRGVMDEASGLIEVVDRCLRVNSPFRLLKTAVFEVDCFALYIGCV